MLLHCHEPIAASPLQHWRCDTPILSIYRILRKYGILVKCATTMFDVAKLLAHYFKFRPGSFCFFARPSPSSTLAKAASEIFHSSHPALFRLVLTLSSNSFIRNEKEALFSAVICVDFCTMRDAASSLPSLPIFSRKFVERPFLRVLPLSATPAFLGRHPFAAKLHNHDLP